MRIMNRFLWAGGLVAAAHGAALAQVPFQVTSPANGASVRETVRMQIPRSSLGDAKYLTLTIDGAFRAGIDIPAYNKDKVIRTNAVEGAERYVNLLWNTKAISKDPKVAEDQRAVQDGPHIIEIGAYNASGRRMASKTLTLNVNNKGQLPSPASGILLSYAIRVGERTKYHQKTEVEYIADPQSAPTAQGTTRFFNGVPGAGQGGFGGAPQGFGGGPQGFGGPPQGFGGGPNGGGGYAPQQPTGPIVLPVQNVTANYERTVEDRSGATYLLRDKVLDGVIASGNGAYDRLENVYNFKSRYRSVRPSGYVEEFAPASATKPGAYIALPIIDLSGSRRRVGDQWSVKAPVLLEWATLNKPDMVDTQNRLEALEWQNGYQTARILQTFNGKADIPLFGGVGTMKSADVKMTRTIWFAYRSQRVIRTETQVDVSGNAPAQVVQQMVPSAGISAGFGGGVPGFGGGVPGFGGGFGGRGGDGEEGGFGGPPVGGIGGGVGAGFGGAQGVPQETLVPAKFRSNTVVTLNVDKSATKKTVVIVKRKKR